MIRHGSLTPATSQRPDRRGSTLADGGGPAAHMTGQAWTGLARTAQSLRPGLLAVVTPTMTAPPLERDTDCRRDLGRQPGSYDSDVTSSCFGWEHDHAIIDRRIGRRAAGCRPRQRAGTPNLSDNVVGGLQPLRARSWIPMPLRAEQHDTGVVTRLENKGYAAAHRAEGSQGARTNEHEVRGEGGVAGASPGPASRAGEAVVAGDGPDPTGTGVSAILIVAICLDGCSRSHHPRRQVAR